MPLALADRLFGGTEPIPGPSRRWLLRYLGVTALLAAIIVVRRPDAVTNPQFWAEDGYVFFYENLTLGFPHALAKLYFWLPLPGAPADRIRRWAGAGRRRRRPCRRSRRRVSRGGAHRSVCGG